jgi:hypothetical protein
VAVSVWKPLLDELDFFLRRKQQRELWELLETCLLPSDKLEAQPHTSQGVESLVQTRMKAQLHHRESSAIRDRFVPVLDLTLALDQSHCLADGSEAMPEAWRLDGVAELSRRSRVRCINT